MYKVIGRTRKDKTCEGPPRPEDVKMVEREGFGTVEDPGALAC
jgi:hypothetical protein